MRRLTHKTLCNIHHTIHIHTVNLSQGGRVRRINWSSSRLAILRCVSGRQNNLVQLCTLALPVVCDKCVCGVCVAYCSIKGSLLWRRRRPNGSSRLCHFLQSLPCTFARPIHSQSNLISTTKRLMESPSHVSLALQVIALQETIYHYFPCVNISISSI